MSNYVKIDHEAAKKMAEAECRSPLFPGQDNHNLAACYLDAMAQLAEWEATARKLTNGLCSDREELEGFIEEMIDILKGELAPLEALRDEATELLRTLKARLDRYESITGDDYADLRAFLAKHRKTGA